MHMMKIVALLHWEWVAEATSRRLEPLPA